MQKHSVGVGVLANCRWRWQLTDPIESGGRGLKCCRFVDSLEVATCLISAFLGSIVTVCRPRHTNLLPGNCNQISTFYLRVCFWND